MSETTSQAIPGFADRAPVELPHPVRMRILGAVMVGVFLAALDQTVVGTALPRIITDLGGNSLYTWAFTAYLLTSRRSASSGPVQSLGVWSSERSRRSRAEVLTITFMLPRNQERNLPNGPLW